MISGRKDRRLSPCPGDGDSLGGDLGCDGDDLGCEGDGDGLGGDLGCDGDDGVTASHGYQI